MFLMDNISVANTQYLQGDARRIDGGDRHAATAEAGHDISVSGEANAWRKVGYGNVCLEVHRQGDAGTAG